MEQSSQPKARRARRPWTDEDQRRAEELRGQGLSYEAIGRHLGFSGHTVRCRLDPIAREKGRAATRRWAETHRDEICERKRSEYWANPEVHRERARRYQVENRSARRQYDKRWRDANREWVRERDRLYGKEWRQANRERDREGRRLRERRWYAADPSRAHAKVYRWRARNPDAYREIARRRNANKRSARGKAMAPVTLDQLQVRFATFGDRCAYCGTASRITVDHVLALSAGGLDEASNIIPACWNCNSGKHARPVEQWYRRQPFFTETRWRKIQRHCPGVAAGQLPLALDPSVVA